MCSSKILSKFSGFLRCSEMHDINSISDISAGFLTCRTINDIVHAVKQGVVDIGIVPLENRIIGRINGSDIDGLQLIRKIKMPIRMALGGLGNKAEINYLISKKEAIAQCSRYINKNGIIPIDAESTAKGIEMLLNYRMNNSAVICSQRALRVSGLRIY